MSYILLIVAFPTPLFIDELLILISIASRIALFLRFLLIANVFASKGFQFLLLENGCCAEAEVSVRLFPKLA